MGRKNDGGEGSLACELVAPQFDSVEHALSLVDRHSLTIASFSFLLCPYFSARCVPLRTTNASLLHSVNAGWREESEHKNDPDSWAY